MIQHHQGKFLLGGLAAVLIAGCASTNMNGGIETASAKFINTDGEVIGSAELTSGPHGTVVRVDIEALSDGGRFHAMHIHSVGDCSDPEQGFLASGGHLNPYGREHGLLNPAGIDAGDFANLYAHEGGVVRQELFTHLATLDGSHGARILGETGAALVIHANEDDHMTQPIGGAGARIACGVIEPWG